MFIFIHHEIHSMRGRVPNHAPWTTYKPFGPLSLCHVLPPAPLAHLAICAGTSSSG
jgi:hypothetical protein